MLGRDGLERFLNLDLDVAEELIGHSSPMFHGRQAAVGHSSHVRQPAARARPRLSSPLLAAAGLHARRRSFAQQLEEEEEAALLNDTIDTNLSAEEALAAAVAASERADQTLAAGAAGSVCSTRSGSSRDGSPLSAVREFALLRAEADAASARAEAADAAGRANRLERVAMDAMLERDDALDELESTRAMLQDAMLHIDALRRRLVDGDLENMMLRANHRPPRTAAASDGVFGLTKTKEAIEGGEGRVRAARGGAAEEDQRAPPQVAPRQARGVGRDGGGGDEADQRGGRAPRRELRAREEARDRILGGSTEP